VAWSMSAVGRFSPRGVRISGSAGATTDTASAMALQPDGKLLIAGSRYRGGVVSGVLRRFDAD
jgi:hypothetical protein